MTRIVLREGAQWKEPADRRIVHRFHYLAQQYGSEAAWLPKHGMLVTRDQSELSRNFPYDTWLAIASYEHPKHQLGQQHLGEQQAYY